MCKRRGPIRPPLHLGFASRARARARLLVFAALAVAGPNQAVGQDAPAPDTDTAVAAMEARLLDRLDALRDRVDSIQREAEARGLLERQSDTVAVDTFRIQGLRVITPAGDSAHVAPWITLALDEITTRTGPLPIALDPPTVRIDWTSGGQRPTPGWSWLRIGNDPPGTVRRRVRGGVQRALTERTPEPVRSWLSSQVGQPADAFPLLAVPASPFVQECFAGATERCPGAIMALDPDARRSLLHHVLRSNAGAFQRLLLMDPAHEPVATAIEIVGDAPLDRLMAEWRRETLAGAPHRLPPTTVATTAAWILLFAGLAARSTRWRLG